MTEKIYVGNLAYSVNSDQLRAAFQKFGDIEEATVIMDRFSGRSKGFGFVTFSQATAARRALEEMDGMDISGRTIRCDSAKGNGGGGAGHHAGGHGGERGRRR